MLSALLTITVVIGVILIGLLFFVLGKLTWLESATTSLLTKIDITPAKDKPQEIQMDPYFYGLTGQDLWNCLTGEDTAQATPLELDERKKLVLNLYYVEELNLKEIGAIIGVKESRVSQILSSVVKELHDAVAKNI